MRCCCSCCRLRWGDSYANATPNLYANPNAKLDANTNLNSNLNTNTDANADADTNPNTDANAHPFLGSENLYPRTTGNGLGSVGQNVR